MLRIHCKCTDKAEGIYVLHYIYTLKISANKKPVAKKMNITPSVNGAPDLVIKPPHQTKS